MPNKQSKANLYCFRCQVKLGKILNRGRFCPICRRKICKKCLASSNYSSLCQASNLTHHTLINYQLLNQKPQSNGKLNENNNFLTINNNLSASTNKLIEINYLNNNNEHNLTNRNLSKSNLSINENDNSKTSLKASSVPNKENLTANDQKQTKQNTQHDSNLNQKAEDKQSNNNNQQVPKKVQRKNVGLYIKRATSSTADSLVARRYRSNLNSASNSKITNQQAQLECFNNKQLSKSCSELNQQPIQQQQVTTNAKQLDSIRCASEQNLNKQNDDNLDVVENNFDDKSASLPKFNLNRLISKLKRSHTVHNVDDIGKRSSLFYRVATGSQTLKNQYNTPKSHDTLWKRSGSATLAAGHQLYLKTLNLGKKSLFKRRSQNLAGIPICKLKGICCSFCFTKM